MKRDACIKKGEKQNNDKSQGHKWKRVKNQKHNQPTPGSWKLMRDGS